MLSNGQLLNLSETYVPGVMRQMWDVAYYETQSILPAATPFDTNIFI